MELQAKGKRINFERYSKRFFLLFLLVVLLFSTLVALTIGSYSISIEDILHILFPSIFSTNLSAEEIHVQESIIFQIRSPRILLSILAGISLSSAGVAYQAVFRNPLVEPYILGISSGAACGAAIAIIFPTLFLIPNSVQILSFSFALFAVFLTHFLAHSADSRSTISLVLTGIILGAIFTAFVGLFKYLAPDNALRELTFWTLGGFYHASWRDVVINSFAILPTTFFIWIFSWKLNLLSLGDEQAQSLGIAPVRTRYFIIFLATLSVSICVSTVGIIAWVGLMMPHLARFMFGQDNRYVILSASLFGAIYMLLCDTMARTVSDAEIPIGIITSLLGAPYLLSLLRTNKREFYD